MLQIKTKHLAVFVGALAMVLAACSSNVPLTQPAPVVDANPKPPAVIQPPVDMIRTPTGPVGTRDVRPVVTEAAPQVTAGVVYFDFDSYVVKPEFQRLLESTARALNANRANKISMAGHTDDLGGREYNLALGQRRAEAVRQGLSLLGVQEAQMEAVSFGKEKPASDGTDEVARAKNRRVEITNR